MRRSRSALIFASLAAALLGPIAALGAPAEAGGSLAGDTDGLRASLGLADYRTCGDLDALAGAWAAHMAASGTLAHNPDLSGEVAGWQSLGENVGEAHDEAAVQTALEHSPDHYANLTSRSFTEAGYGTAVGAGGQLWVDEVFRQPQGAACAGTASQDVAVGSTQRAGAVSRSMDRTAMVPTLPAALMAPVRPVDPSIARTAAARARLTRLSVTPAPPRDVVAAALAFEKAMTVS